MLGKLPREWCLWDWAQYSAPPAGPSCNDPGLGTCITGWSLAWPCPKGLLEQGLEASCPAQGELET